jgi:hypothetical protein
MKKFISCKKRDLIRQGFMVLVVASFFVTSCSKQNDSSTITPKSLMQSQSALSKSVPATSPGTLVATVDVNGDGIPDKIYNNGSSVVVVRSTGVTDTYFISSGNWSIVPAAITDLDGVAGAEITVIVGEYVKIITDKKGTVTSYTLGLSDWSLITTGSNGVSDMDGIAGAEIAIANGNYLTILCQRTGTLTNYLVSTGNWSLLSNGIQNFDGKPGNDIALTIFTSSNIEIIHPKTGSIATYSSNTFGISWFVQGYTANSPAGINIHIYSTTKGKTYTIVDATQTITSP